MPLAPFISLGLCAFTALQWYHWGCAGRLCGLLPVPGKSRYWLSHLWSTVRYSRILLQLAQSLQL